MPGIEAARPDLRLLLDREVERRLEQMGKSNRARALLAIGRRPALPEPVRGVEAGFVLRLDQPLALARDPPQHGIDEAAREGLPAARQRHRLADRGVRRGLEEQQLDRAEPEQIAHPDRLGRRPQEALEHGINLAEPAQRGRRQQARVRPVTRRKQALPRVAGQDVVERPLLAEHEIEHIERDPAGAVRDRARRGRHRIERDAQAAGWSIGRPARACSISRAVAAAP